MLRRTWLPIDLDPGRPAGISATEAEHEAAIEKARELRRFLVQELGWPEPVAADSGNGGHLNSRIDLPNDDDSPELVRKMLLALDAKFSGKKDAKGNLLDGEIGVDTSVHNAARIWKLYGTMAGKGDSLLPWKPFPVEALPEPVRSYVRLVSATIGCDPSYVAVPMLPVLASAKPP